jgi:expansin (peptidoglycan-binding protein)
LRQSAGLGGEFLAGVANAYNQNGGVCDACILIETALGHSIVARVVTYGVEQEDGDIDVSPSVFEAINEDEFPRTMSWSFTTCPDVGPLRYEFQTGANAFWTSLWVRNPAVPIEKVEVKSANHASFFELRRESDGTLNDDRGFGEGAFTLRVTGIDGSTADESFPGFNPGELVTGKEQL